MVKLNNRKFKLKKIKKKKYKKKKKKINNFHIKINKFNKTF